MRAMERRIDITEDGEAIGTLQQFSRSLNLSRSSILQCVQNEAQGSIILNAGEGLDRFLIIDAQGLKALHQCATQTNPSDHAPVEA